MKNTYLNNTSPHGNLFVKSIPVNGVPVGGSKIALSMHNHSTFKEPFDISQYLKNPMVNCNLYYTI